MKTKIIIFIAVLVVTTACRKDSIVFPPEIESVDTPSVVTINGFYLLNEGNMGSNKATLDYYDAKKGEYQRNIFAAANPTVPKELGDVGNDLQIYGSKLYAVINCSNKIEVMDKKTTKRIGQIDILNCRYIRFHEQFAYVTSYAGPVVLDPNYKQLGFVAKIDTATLEEVDRCVIGFQPDELAITNGNIYVANSGGYMFPNYESTVSVINLNSFTEIDRIDVAINLHRIRADQYGFLWVAARGDYYDQPSKLYYVNTADHKVDSLDIAVSNCWLDGDSLYVCSTAWSYITMQNEITYGIVHVKTQQIVTHNFITDGTEKNIRIPYGIAVNPATKDVYVTDAKNYVSPGVLHCYNANGIHKWSVTTGDIPAHFAFDKAIPSQTDAKKMTKLQ